MPTTCIYIYLFMICICIYIYIYVLCKIQLCTCHYLALAGLVEQFQALLQDFACEESLGGMDRMEIEGSNCTFFWAQLPVLFIYTGRSFFGLPSIWNPIFGAYNFCTSRIFWANQKEHE